MRNWLTAFRRWLFPRKAASFIFRWTLNTILKTVLQYWMFQATFYCQNRRNYTVEWRNLKSCKKSWLMSSNYSWRSWYKTKEVSKRLKNSAKQVLQKKPKKMWDGVHEEQKRWSRSYCSVLVDEEPRYSQTKEFILVAQD